MLLFISGVGKPQVRYIWAGLTLLLTVKEYRVSHFVIQMLFYLLHGDTPYSVEFFKPTLATNSRVSTAGTSTKVMSGFLFTQF